MRTAAIVSGMVILSTAACENQQRAGQRAGESPQAAAASPASREVAGVSAAAAANHRILVRLQPSGSTCVVAVVTPKRQPVHPTDKVKWKYKNECKQGVKKPKIDLKKAPISGDCATEIVLAEDADEEGRDCTVSNAGVGVYQYGIYGDGIVHLDPELEIPPPPPPLAAKSEPPPSPK